MFVGTVHWKGDFVTSNIANLSDSIVPPYTIILPSGAKTNKYKLKKYI